MAGMLAGVETARRRRIHQTSVCSSSSSSSSSGPNLGIGSALCARRFSLSFFSTNSSPSLPRTRSRAYQVDEKLGQLAREAKERLDERLRAQRKSQFTWNNNSDVSEELLEERVERRTSGYANVRELRTEVFGIGTKKKGSKRGLAKLGLKWKLQCEEQKECAVCLEEFSVGENLINLPCAHKFHSTCLLPWLHTHLHCPCCRMSLLS